MRPFLFYVLTGGAISCLLSSPLAAKPPAYPGEQADFWQAVQWKTPDGVTLAGRYHPAAGQKVTWILLHGLGSGKGEWDPFARQATAELGHGFLIYDLRGHGESVQGAKGQKLDYQQWMQTGPGSPWSAMADDLKSAVKMLMDRYRIAEVRIAVGGASLGANVAMVYAGSHPKVPAVILLSPGAAYAGAEITPAFKKYGRRTVFMAASPEDAYAYNSVRKLAAERSDDGLRLAEGRGAAHGVNMLDPTFTPKLIHWMRQVDTSNK